MNAKISKSNLTAQRLAEVRMGEYDRLVAQAHLARAEAMAELAVRGLAAIRKGLYALAFRPYRRTSASHG